MEKHLIHTLVACDFVNRSFLSILISSFAILLASFASLRILKIRKKAVIVTNRIRQR